MERKNIKLAAAQNSRQSRTRTIRKPLRFLQDSTDWLESEISSSSKKARLERQHSPQMRGERELEVDMEVKVKEEELLENDVKIEIEEEDVPDTITGDPLYIDPSATTDIKGNQGTRFPKEEELQQEQVWAKPWEDFLPTNHERLSPQDFKEKDMDETYIPHVHMSDGAVPSVVETIPEHLQPKKRQKKKAQMEREVPESHDVTVVKPQFSDHVVGSMTNYLALQEAETLHLKRELKKTENALEKANKKIKMLQQSISCLVKKNSNLQDVVGELKKKSLNL